MNKKFLFAVPFILIPFAGTSQDTLNRELPPFTALQVSDKMTVHLIRADKESVTIKADGIDPQQIQTTVENNTLIIGFARHRLQKTESDGKPVFQSDPRNGYP